jgi:hypothetical protein
MKLQECTIGTLVLSTENWDTGCEIGHIVGVDYKSGVKPAISTLAERIAATHIVVRFPGKVERTIDPKHLEIL